MGIPKFYRWISERYPCLSEKIREYQIPDFDNLYLDMNGIIHSCSHPNDDDVHLRIPEEAVFKEIFRYIDFLFKMIKPRKVFFMAIDGVAPRAKMNQQRGRRFRSAKLAQDQEAEAVRKGEKLPSEDRFDSNCITPGTEFMARLHEQLQYFVKVKVSTDVLWQREGLVIYLSGHDVPGEGEHKIMDFIRHIRSQPEYNAETRHCLYGLDADLIMLGLSTHELHFSLLREEVKFGGGARKRKRPTLALPSNNDGGSKFDVNAVSVLKPVTEQVNVDETVMETVGGVSETSVVKPSLSFAGALKAEPPPDTKADVTPGVQNGEQGLMPSEQSKKKDVYHPPIPEKTTFLLLHLSLLRDYLDEEFQPLKEILKDHPTIEYDLEKLIDDWILMCILVGNDFVPNLPNLHITTNALPMVYDKYMNILPRMGGYINENGILNLERFEIFMTEISVYDVENFRQTYDDMKYMASKTGKNIVLGDQMMEAFEFDNDDGFTEEAIEVEEEAAPSSGLMSELQALINRTEESLFGSKSEGENGDVGKTSAEIFPIDDEIFDEEDSQELRLEFAQFKRNYYMTKMHFKDVTREVQQLAIEYIRAVQWVLLYYYKGVSSWCWYYPAHYAPFASDLRNFKNISITFDKGQPFRPFEQLLAVLPSHSKKLLPACYQWLMTDSKSPIIEYYPEKFEQDLNGKKQDWEAVILIPFIDEKQLLVAMETEASKLSNVENFRNSRGKLLLYSYTPDDTGPVAPVASAFPTLPVSHYKLETLEEVPYNPALLPKGVHPKAIRDRVYQGFPTIKSIPHKSYLKDVQVKVFEMQARDVSMVLDLNVDESKEHQTPDVEATARSLLGKMVWVNWPHLTPALVTGVSSGNVKYVDMQNGQLVQDKKHTADEQDTVLEGLIRRHLTSKAIKLAEMDIVIWGKLMEGRKLRFDKEGRIVVKNLWQKAEQPFAYQTIITHENYVTVFSMTDREAETFRDVYRPGDLVFLLDREVLGAKAAVKDADRKRAKVIVEYNIPVYRNINNEADRNVFECLTKWNNDNYFTTPEAARMCNLDAFTFSKITGSIFITVEKGGSPKKSKGKKKKRDRKGRKENEDADGADGKSSSDSEDVHIAQETKRVNVGLDLKFNKKNQKARGYTTKEASIGNKNGKWNYSMKTVKLVQEYVQKFPDFVEFLRRNCSYDKNGDNYLASEIFPDDPIGRIREMQDWIDNLGLRHSVQRVDISSDILDDDEIQIIWKHILGCRLHARADDHKSLTVSPNQLLKPGLTRGSVEPVPGETFDVLDRIICVDPSASMPLGQKGTIVGIQEPQAREQKDTVEESFKATSATLLMTLIVLPDPQPDIFDKASEDGMTTGKSSASTQEVKKDMTLALNQFLGLTAPTDEVLKVEEKKESITAEQEQPEEYKPVPRLVKLFPYQVINITDTEVLEYVNETNKDAEQQNELSVRRNRGRQNNYNNYNKMREQKIPPLLSLRTESSLPKTRPTNSVQPPFKLINFVKSSDSPVSQQPSQQSVPTAILRKGGSLVFENSARNESRNYPAAGQLKQKGGHVSEPSKRDARTRKERPTEDFHPPITILKRPSQNTGPEAAGAQKNPIFGLLESSLKQKKPPRNGRERNDNKKEFNTKDRKELEQQVQDIQNQKLREEKKRQRPVEKKSEKSRGEQVVPPRTEDAQNSIKPDPTQLLQLLQKQVPDPHRSQNHHVGNHHPNVQPNIGPRPNMSQFPQPVPVMFPPQQAQLMGFHPGQHMIHPFAPFMVQQQPNGQPLLYPINPSQMPFPQVHPQQNPQMVGQNGANSSRGRNTNKKKTTTSFVPTQVLAGGRGGSVPFVGGSKPAKTAVSAQASATVSSANHDEPSLPQQSSSSKENVGGNEVNIDALLHEANRQKESVNGKLKNKPLGIEAGQELLSQLTNQFSVFGMQESTGPKISSTQVDHPIAAPPSKSRLAANFSLGP